LTDALAGIDLYFVESYSQKGRGLTISGHHGGEAARRAFEELFQDCESGCVLHVIPGGAPIAEDLSEDEMYTQFLSIPSQSKVIAGFYQLRGFSKSGDDYLTGLYAWQMQLQFIGTTATYTRGYDVDDVDEVTSDWVI
jgi:hypothetical protein